MHRAVRALMSIRKQLTAPTLGAFLGQALPQNSDTKTRLEGYLQGVRAQRFRYTAQTGSTMSYMLRTRPPLSLKAAALNPKTPTYPKTPSPIASVRNCTYKASARCIPSLEAAEGAKALKAMGSHEALDSA